MGMKNIYQDRKLISVLAWKWFQNEKKEPFLTYNQSNKKSIDCEIS